MQIHSQAEPPFVHELGFGVAPGFQTFVATQEQRVSELDLTSTLPDFTSPFTAITNFLLYICVIS